MEILCEVVGRNQRRASETHLTQQNRVKKSNTPAVWLTARVKFCRARGEIPAYLYDDDEIARNSKKSYFAATFFSKGIWSKTLKFV